MTDFKTDLLEVQDEVYTELEDGGASQDVLSNFLDASDRIITEAVLLHEAGDEPDLMLGHVFDEVRTTFALDWERGSLGACSLATVDEVIGRTYAVLDAMEDCE